MPADELRLSTLETNVAALNISVSELKDDVHGSRRGIGLLHRQEATEKRVGTLEDLATELAEERKDRQADGRSLRRLVWLIGAILSIVSAVIGLPILNTLSQISRTLPP